MVQRFDIGSGLSVAADVGGDPAGSPVLLLHGGGQTRHSWKKTFDALVAAGHYVVSPDARGHGDSDWDPNGDYSLDALVADLLALLAQIPPRPVLIGASMGGLTALAAVGEAEQSFARALALVDIAPTMNAEGIEQITAFMRSNEQGFTSLDDAVDAVAKFNPHRPRPSDASGLARNLRERDGRLYWHWDPRLISPNQHDREALQSRLIAAARRLRVPTLLIRGELSNVVGQREVEHFRALVPDAEFIDVADASHMVAGDRNDAFSQSVLDFITRVERGEGLPSAAV